MKKMECWKKKLGTLTDESAFNFIVHNAVRPLCSSSNFSTILHQTSHLFITTVGTYYSDSTSLRGTSVASIIFDCSF